MQCARSEIQRVEHLDAAVHEVFRIMLGVECLPATEVPREERDTLTAMVGLAGSLGGVCVLRTGTSVALRMAESLAGIAFTEMDEIVKDAIGEISNMLAGAWKGHLAELSAACMLSVPAIVTGKDYRVHLQVPKFRIARCYRFGESVFSLEILVESI